MTYPSRIDAISAYLRKNGELIEAMEKGRIEINFAGSSISTKTIELSEDIKIEVRLTSGT